MIFWISIFYFAGLIWMAYEVSTAKLDPNDP
jgi:hypothetical protein